VGAVPDRRGGVPRHAARSVRLDGCERNLVWFGWLLTGVVAQVVGYVRLADHEQRQQTKLVLLGIAVGVGCFYALAFPRALFPTAPMARARDRRAARDVRRRAGWCR
jgi:uncharacterized oligopeptide transporter (OPT) family protein